MPDDDLSVVRAAFDAWFRGDEAAWLERMAPDIVVTQLPEQPDSGSYSGHDGMRHAVGGWIESWDDYSVELHDLRPAGGCVLAAIDQRGRGRGSGVEMSARTWFVFTVRDGRIARWRMFSSEEQALEAASGPE